MINIRRRTCYVCEALATHNTIDETLLYKLCGLYCEEHQLPNMVNIKEHKIMTKKGITRGIVL